MLLLNRTDVNVMKIEWLRVLIEIASMGSMSKAANNLYMSEQNVSRIIKSMEDELKTKILIKTPKGCKLTDSGAILFNFATKTLNSYQVVKNTIASLENQSQEKNNSHPIKIITSYGLSAMFVRFSFSKNGKNLKIIPSIISYEPNYIYNQFKDLDADIIAFTIPEKKFNAFVAEITDSYTLEYFCFDFPHLIASKSFFIINNLSEQPLTMEQIKSLPSIAFFNELSGENISTVNIQGHENNATTNSINYLWKNVYNGNACLIGFPLVAQIYDKKRSQNLIMTRIIEENRWVHLILKKKNASKFVDIFLQDWFMQNRDYVNRVGGLI